MDKILKFSFVLILLASHVNGQSNLLNAKTPQQIGVKTDNQKKYDNTKPLEYGYIDDRDIMFGKKVWETIDLEQRINFPLYYPLTSKLDRLSLFETLKQYVNDSPEEKIKNFVFEGDDDYFKLPIGKKDIENKFKNRSLLPAANDSIDIYNTNKLAEGTPDFELFIDKLIKEKKLKSGKHFVEAEIESKDIKSYAIQGYWYFDKRLSELKYRLIAIGPRATPADVKVNAEKNKKKVEADAKQKAKDEDREMTKEEEKQMEDEIANLDKNLEPTVLFWIYYPSIRSILKKQNSFNDRNSSKPINLDDLLVSRHFNAVIYREENVSDDRTIAGYKPNDAMDQLLESERVKDKIRDFEHDLWNY
jgi:gliding motility associated protien GldN